jgi:hypothetical protein
MTCNANDQVCGDYLGHNSISKTGKKLIFKVFFSVIYNETSLFIISFDNFSKN